MATAWPFFFGMSSIPQIECLQNAVRVIGRPRRPVVKRRRAPGDASESSGKKKEGEDVAHGEEAGLAAGTIADQ
ncbi:hypothetical protein [Citrifermentans bremense]|uniref:hypothetical protein n=1 Tax=Citrifermentans bremense TaxID=60035 RepID=UPI00047EFC4C|nr:hypothetical protein [Citrifermentans bremense]